MKKEDFYYDLPEERIAQSPSDKREESRLLCLDRVSGATTHSTFADIVELLTCDDLLVLNNTKVIPARLIGKKETGGSVEVFLLSQKEENVWEVLVRPSARVKKGVKIIFPDSALCCYALDEPGERTRRVRFECRGDFWAEVDRIGKMPLPPYIKRDAVEVDGYDYQTVYAKERGAVAAPTAGLHFTEELLAALQAKGVEIAHVTLHVGYGTFFPVQTDDIRDHVMHTEEYEISEDAARVINQAKENGKRIVACGTTTVRTLESAATDNGAVSAGRGATNIFIYPPYAFKIVNALITNFHLPESTLLMLVSALAGREHVLRAYEVAKEARYRFYSYGDAMFIT